MGCSNPSSVRPQASHSEAESLKRQEALIAEEERAGAELGARAAAKAEADRVRKARKKEKRKVRPALNPNVFILMWCAIYPGPRTPAQDPWERGAPSGSGTGAL